MSNLMSFAATALKNLVSKPATTQYPEVPKEYPERTRGHVENDIEQCILCGMCMRKCPPGAIKVDRTKGTWSIERFDCIQCGYCTEVCPKKCLKMVPGYQQPETKKEAETIHKPNIQQPSQPSMPKKTAAALENGSNAGTQIPNKEQQEQIQQAERNAAITTESSGKIVPVPDQSACVYCTLCAKKCPAGAITVNREKKEWSVDKEACLSCGVCEDSCPKHCIHLQ